MAVAFVSDSSQISIDRVNGPVGGRQTTIRRVQPHEFSLGGVFYLYDHGATVTDHRLLFSRIPTVQLEQIYSFFDNDARGGMRQFILREDGAPDRLVHLAGQLETREQYPGRHSLAVTLTELDLSDFGLLDQFGQQLLDSDGNVILGL